jgi:hypothetical protein
MLVYFMIIWNIFRPLGVFLWPFGAVCGHFVHIFFPVLVCLDLEKSGNPGPNACNKRQPVCPRTQPDAHA